MTDAGYESLEDFIDHCRTGDSIRSSSVRCTSSIRCTLRGRYVKSKNFAREIALLFDTDPNSEEVLENIMNAKMSEIWLFRLLSMIFKKYTLTVTDLVNRGLIDSVDVKINDYKQFVPHTDPALWSLFADTTEDFEKIMIDAHETRVAKCLRQIKQYTKKLDEFDDEPEPEPDHHVIEISNSSDDHVIEISNSSDDHIIEISNSSDDETTTKKRKIIEDSRKRKKMAEIRVAKYLAAQQIVESLPEHILGYIYLSDLTLMLSKKLTQ